MKLDQNFFTGLFFGLFLFFMYIQFFSKKASSYTIQDFPDSMPMSQAEALYKTQTTGISTELSQKLLGNTSKDDMIKVTWQYSDAINDLNKKYASYRIRNSPTPGAKPSPAPQAVS
jgi:hypothetical protein